MLSYASNQGEERPRGRTASERVASSDAGEPRGELTPVFDAELAITVRQVHLDGPQGDEEGLGDLFVGLAFGGELDDPELCRGEGVAAGLGDAAGAGAGEPQLLQGMVDERRGAAAMGEIGALGERFPGPARARRRGG